MATTVTTTVRGNAMVPVRDCKQGQYLQLKEGGPVFIRKGYDTGSKRFELQYFMDVNRSRLVKGDTLAITDAEF